MQERSHSTVVFPSTAVQPQLASCSGSRVASVQSATTKWRRLLWTLPSLWGTVRTGRWARLHSVSKGHPGDSGHVTVCEGGGRQAEVVGLSLS